MVVVNKIIIPLALVGYEMIIANSALRASLAIYHLISNARSWNNCLNIQQMIGVLAARNNLKVKNARQPVERKDI